MNPSIRLHETQPAAALPFPRSLKLLATFGLVAGVCLTPEASAQVLFGLDAGGGIAPPMQIHTLQLAACGAAGACMPTDMIGGHIGMRWGMPPVGVTPGGGVSLDESSGERWLTPGPTLHRIDPICGHIDQWDVLTALPADPLFPAASARAWTGLAHAKSIGKIFFTDHNRIAELDVPPAASGGGVLPIAGLSFVTAPAGLVPPLTDIAYDAMDDTLWVIDSLSNVAHMARPSAGGAVALSFNVDVAFGGAAAMMCEGLALDIFAQPAGHPRGMLAVVDSGNQLFMVATDGTALASCFLGGVPLQLVGLVWPMPKPHVYCTGKVNSCGSVPAMSFSGVPSASASSGFMVRCVNAKANRPGLFIYGNSGRNAAPLAGGTLCVMGPVSRTPGLFTSGTAGLCDGVMQLDFNLFSSGGAGGTPKPFLLVPGEVINVQAYGRDNMVIGAFLSDGMEYIVQP